MSFFARTKNISRSSQVSKVGQGFLQVLDLYLMSTNSAAGWICLASLHSCMNCTSTSSYGKDTKLYTVCLAELLWGFTLKALGKVCRCNLALKTCPVHFLCHKIYITPKSLCQQTGHMLHSQYGEQMWIAYELYVVTCLSSQHSADHLQYCENSVMVLNTANEQCILWVYVYSHKHTYLNWQIIYKIGTSVKRYQLSFLRRICVWPSKDFNGNLSVSIQI